MKFRSLLLCVFFLLFHPLWSQDRREVGALIMENIPEIPEELDERLKQYENVRGAFLEDWLPDGEGIIITTRFANTPQLHLVEGPGMARQQITFFDEPVTNAYYCPSSEWDGFLFLKDVGGGEFDQLFWFNREDGSTTMLSDGESKNGDVSWSNSGDQFIYSSTRRNGRNHDLYLSSMRDPTHAERIIETDDGYWGVGDWSPSDNKVLINQYLSINEMNTFIYDQKKGDLIQVNKSDTKGVNYGVGWSNSPHEIFLFSDQEGEFNNLIRYNLETNSQVNLTKDIPFDVNGFAISPDRDRAAFTVNENGMSKLYLLNPSTGNYKKFDALPPALIYALKFSPDGNELGFGMSSSNSPGDIYSLNLESNQIIQWTKSELGGLNSENFPQPDLIYFPTFDFENGKQRELPAFIYKPTSGQEPYPVIINIHGGPEGQFKPGFNPMRAYMVNEMGLAYIAPNVRGSSGYGKSFLKLDNGFKREDSVKDIGALIAWIKKQPDLDESRVAVLGGSYGGYMVLSSMMHYNKDIACGIDIVGISNFVTFLENTQPYRQNARRLEYGDERDPEMRQFLESISPNNHVDKITKPLLVIQGANDPRVPLSESEQIVSAMKNESKEVWFMVAKNEGHGFRKKDNREQLNRVISLFLEKYLLKDKEQATSGTGK